MSGSSSTLSGLRGGQCEVEKDHDIQCDDLTELVSVAEFKEKCREICRDIFEDHVMEVSGTEAERQQIEEDTAALVPPGGLEPILKGKQPGALRHTQLQCLNNIKAQKEYFERKSLTNNMVPPPGQPPDTGSAGVSPDAGCEGVSPTVTHPEVILSLYVFHPIKKRRDTQILVLGSQLLTELRDKISCFRDYIVYQDYSEHPDSYDHRMMHGKPPSSSPSAFFFINNTFYNDRRHARSRDLSSSIRRWAESEDRIAKSSRLDHFTTADMATTRMDQLQLRLGYPYLYCHHDNCQHLIVFTDLRLLHPTDSQNISDYPKIFAKHIGKRRKCHVCDVFSPIWVTLEDELAPESPCLFCEDCFKKLHYSEDGEKMCHFKAYPYNPTILV